MQHFAKATAQILLDTGCILTSPHQPFTLTSGKKSPVYVDCRKLIAFPQARQHIMQMGYEMLLDQAGNKFDCVAGGETAGIAYAAWLADKYNSPMAYIRKKPKGFGKNARIEGDMYEGQNVLLVEDLFTNGGSKISFLDAINDIGAVCNHCFVIFRYGIFPEEEAKFAARGVQLHALACWQDVLDEISQSGQLQPDEIATIQAFLQDPDGYQAKQL
ncbi:MAG: orotate phosphoribosyltransferase [Alphaproteobacteria bacterium]|nr:orotate phosphoribosyltransferase [Alphaproteobacteria bacterium]